MNIKVRGTEMLAISEVADNQFSANVEDSATFNRLKKELKKVGMIENPVVFFDGKEYRFISGHHRARAWLAIGNDSTLCTVLEGDMTAEEEFNLVNNLNQVKGNISLSNVKRIIRADKLDVTQLDVFKVPVSRLIPKQSSVGDEDAAKKAKMRDLALKIASEIATLVVEQMDEAVIVLHNEGKVGAIVHIPLNSTSIRQGVPGFKEAIQQALNESFPD